MNSERKAFLEYWYENNLPYEGDDELKDCAWLAWQASAQRQGYKLVPVEPTQKMIESAIIERSKHGRTDSCIYKAMIGAVDE